MSPSLKTKARAIGFIALTLGVTIAASSTAENVSAAKASLALVPTCAEQYDADIDMCNDANFASPNNGQLAICRATAVAAYYLCKATRSNNPPPEQQDEVKP